MNARQGTHDAGMGVSFIISTVIHLAVFLLLLWWGQLFPPTMAVQETYYVDVVNLPVANPRAGSSTQKGNDAEAPPPPPAPEPPLSNPSPLKPDARRRAATAGKAEKRETSSDASFAERMAKLENKAASQQEEAALEQLRKKIRTTGSGKAGMPAGSGSETGSDYTAYIQSRLKDALNQTNDYDSNNPMVYVHLYIGTDGKVIRQKIEQSTGDKRFEQAVQRAIEKAGDKLVPPPSHKVFEGKFRFRPKEVFRGKP
jgi:colicin import membrane protein